MKAPNILIPALGLVVALVVGGLVYVFAGPIRYHPAHFLTLLNAPQVVRDMVFMVERPGASGLARVVSGGIKTDWFPGITFRSLDQRSGVLVAVIEQTGNGAVDVVEVRSGELIPLTSDGTWKGGATISPDATYYAYTVRISEPLLDEAAREIYDVGDYQTEIRSFDGTYTRTVSGNHPHFFDRDTLVVFSSRGIEAHGLVARTESYGPVHDEKFHTPSRPSFGTNRVFLTQVPSSPQWLAHEYSPESPLYYSFFGALPNTRGGFALTKDEAVYHGIEEDGAFKIRSVTSLTESPTTIFSIDARYFNPHSAIFSL